MNVKCTLFRLCSSPLRDIHNSLYLGTVDVTEDTEEGERRLGGSGVEGAHHEYI